MKTLTLIILSIFLILFIPGCQSGVVMKAGGYSMIHFNNPECMGSSAAGALIVHEETQDVVKSNIGFKTGYCEAVTGQVIAVGGEIAGAKIQSKGLAKSGRATVNNANSTEQAVVEGLNLKEEPENMPQ